VVDCFGCHTCSITRPYTCEVVDRVVEDWFFHYAAPKWCPRKGDDEHEK
jgi:hypothetical protein